MQKYSKNIPEWLTEGLLISFHAFHQDKLKILIFIDSLEKEVPSLIWVDGGRREFWLRIAGP